MCISTFCKEIRSSTTSSCSLSPRLLQEIHKAFTANPNLATHLVRDESSSKTVEKFILFLEACIFLEKYDQVSKLTSAQMDLRLQDAKFRAETYKKKGKPNLMDMGYELKGRFCSLPFSQFHITVSGEVFLCCCGWGGMSVGNFFRQSSDTIWNSPKARQIRQSILDGSFSYCGKQYCYPIRTQTIPLKNQLRPGYRSSKMNTGPKHFNLSYDLTCNLACPTCRPKKMVMNGEMQIMLDVLIACKVLPLLKGASVLEIAGSGEPFASKTFRDLLSKLKKDHYPELYIVLMTNGLLATPEQWTWLEQNNVFVSQVNVSIDAATEKTYEQVRGSVNFRKLLNNLEFIAGLRRSARIKYFKTAFVVQAANYKEMPRFVTLSKRYHVDQVHFQQLGNWRAMQQEQYHALAIHRPEHPWHEDFISVLKDPLLKDPIVANEFVQPQV